MPTIHISAETKQLVEAHAPEIILAPITPCGEEFHLTVDDLLLLMLLIELRILGGTLDEILAQHLREYAATKTRMTH